MSGYHLQLTLFGSPEVRLHGQAVTGFRSSKAQALLYYLAVTGRPHTRPTLAGLFWGDQPEAAARVSLSKCLSNLRDLVGEAVLVDRQTVAFNRNQPYHLDTEGFLAGIGQPPTPETLSTWQAALALYRGDFLEGFYVRDAPDFEQWVLVQRAHYRETALQGLHTLANWHEQQGDLLQAISHTRRLLTLEPWREEGQRQLMTRLARSGQRAAALAQFETCRRVLDEELAVEPDAETQALVEAIRADKMTRWHDDKITLASPHPVIFSSGHLVINNLPIPPTPLIGRKREMAELAQMIGNRQCRLITITGTGGMGKTRLALAVATAQANSFRHGAAFVPLAAISDPTFVAHAILQALEQPLQGSQNPQIQLLGYLRDKEILLVLDNYEQLLPDVALLIEILGRAAEITLLVTSRERLALQAEQLFPLEGLDYPFAPAVHDALETFAAFQLFLQRARQIKPSFALNDDARAAIVRICQVSEGLPLAIELAVGALRTQSALAIASAFEASHLLPVAHLRDLPARHLSIQEVFEHSWQLLTIQEQGVFARLSVFRAGFVLDAAKKVADAEVELLTALVDKSLVRQQAGDRFDLHELLRHYAAEKLNNCGYKNETHWRHLHYFLALAEDTELRMGNAQKKVWHEHLEMNQDNLRAALRYALNVDPAAALRLAGALGEFWYFRGYNSEGQRWLIQALAQNSGTLAPGRGKVLREAGRIALAQGDYIQAAELLDESLQLAQQLNDKYELARSLNFRGYVPLHQNELTEARPFFEQSLTLGHELNNRYSIAVALNSLGLVTMYQGDYNKAGSLFEESLAIKRSLEHPIGVELVLTNLGYNELHRGNPNSSRQYFKQGLQICLKQGDKEGIAFCLEGLAQIAGLYGEEPEHTRSATRLLGAAETLRNRLGTPLPPMDQAFYNRSMSMLRTQLDGVVFTTAWAEGQAMPLEQAVECALADPTTQ